MSFNQAHFKGAVQIDADLSGPTVTQIQSNATSTLNSLNGQISAFNSEVASSTQRFAAAADARDAMVQQSTAAMAALDQKHDANKADSDAKMAQETADRLAGEQAQANKNTALDGEIASLNALHISDDARLTSVEAELKSVDTDIKAQIQERIDAHNADLSNTLPRLAKLENYFVIDESDPQNPVVRIKAGTAFVVEGDFTHQ